MNQECNEKIVGILVEENELFKKYILPRNKLTSVVIGTSHSVFIPFSLSVKICSLIAATAYAAK